MFLFAHGPVRGQPPGIPGRSVPEPAAEGAVPSPAKGRRKKPKNAKKMRISVSLPAWHGNSRGFSSPERSVKKGRFPGSIMHSPSVREPSPSKDEKRRPSRPRRRKPRRIVKPPGTARPGCTEGRKEASRPFVTPASPPAEKLHFSAAPRSNGMPLHRILRRPANGPRQKPGRGGAEGGRRRAACVFRRSPIPLGKAMPALSRRRRVPPQPGLHPNPSRGLPVVRPSVTSGSACRSGFPTDRAFLFPHPFMSS